MVKIVKDELTELMGGDAEGVNLSASPSIILCLVYKGRGKQLFQVNLPIT